MVSEHPIVTMHPETGERVLFVSPSYVKSISGMTDRESQQFLELLWEQALRPEFTVRFRWEPGSVAFWTIALRLIWLQPIFTRLILTGSSTVSLCSARSQGRLTERRRGRLKVIRSGPSNVSESCGCI